MSNTMRTFIVVLPCAYGVGDTLRDATRNAVRAMPSYLKRETRDIDAHVFACSAPQSEIDIVAGFGVQVTPPAGAVSVDWKEPVRVRAAR